MVELAKLNADVRHYFEDTLHEQWILTFDGDFRYKYMTTNRSEPYNVVLKNAKKL